MLVASSISTSFDSACTSILPKDNPEIDKLESLFEIELKKYGDLFKTYPLDSLSLSLPRENVAFLSTLYTFTVISIFWKQIHPDWNVGSNIHAMNSLKYFFLKYHKTGWLLLDHKELLQTYYDALSEAIEIYEKESRGSLSSLHSTAGSLQNSAENHAFPDKLTDIKSFLLSAILSSLLLNFNLCNRAYFCAACYHLHHCFQNLKLLKIDSVSVLPLLAEGSFWVHEIGRIPRVIGLKLEWIEQLINSTKDLVTEKGTPDSDEQLKIISILKQYLHHIKNEKTAECDLKKITEELGKLKNYPNSPISKLLDLLDTFHPKSCASYSEKLAFADSPQELFNAFRKTNPIHQILSVLVRQFELIQKFIEESAKNENLTVLRTASEHVYMEWEDATMQVKKLAEKCETFKSYHAWFVANSRNIKENEPTHLLRLHLTNHDLLTNQLPLHRIAVNGKNESPNPLNFVPIPLFLKKELIEQLRLPDVLLLAEKLNRGRFSFTYTVTKNFSFFSLSKSYKFIIHVNFIDHEGITPLFLACFETETSSAAALTSEKNLVETIQIENAWKQFSEETDLFKETFPLIPEFYLRKAKELCQYIFTIKQKIIQKTLENRAIVKLIGEIQQNQLLIESLYTMTSLKCPITTFNFITYCRLFTTAKIPILSDHILSGKKNYQAVINQFLTESGFPAFPSLYVEKYKTEHAEILRKLPDNFFEERTESYPLKIATYQSLIDEMFPQIQKLIALRKTPSEASSSILPRSLSSTASSVHTLTASLLDYPSTTLTTESQEVVESKALSSTLSTLSTSSDKSKMEDAIDPEWQVISWDLEEEELTQEDNFNIPLKSFKEF